MSKPKYSIISPEDISLDERYSFSYNPEEQPDVQRFYCITLKCFESWSQKIYEIFSTLRYCEIETYVEISKAGRLHFHGYIRITDIANFYFYDLRKLKHYGTFEIDFIEQDENWDAYIKKQSWFMEDFCKKNNMQYHFNTE